MLPGAAGVFREHVEVGVEELDGFPFLPSFLALYVHVVKLSLVETKESSGLGEYIYVSIRACIRRNSLFSVRIVVFLDLSTLYIWTYETGFPDKVELFADFEYPVGSEIIPFEQVFGSGGLRIE